MDVLKVLNDLGQVRAFDYFKKRSMPEFVEPLIEGLLASVSSMSALELEQLRISVNDRAAAVLAWYARKFSGRAVRNDSKEDIYKVVLALAIAAQRSDCRDILAQVALASDAATRLGQYPQALFDSAASKLASVRSKELFQMFVDRPPNLKSISAFGFSEGVGPHGFDYVPLLAEYGGPTPI